MRRAYTHNFCEAIRGSELMCVALGAYRKVIIRLLKKVIQPPPRGGACLVASKVFQISFEG